mmetsp:Transcript_9797/g.17143  ORF Transcript_9797/g.17143 Transcript_9797/m.17143 type:complete len:227 (+) Transcript_9797:2216-2896(+)
MDKLRDTNASLPYLILLVSAVVKLEENDSVIELAGTLERLVNRTNGIVNPNGSKVFVVGTVVRPISHIIAIRNAVIIKLGRHANHAPATGHTGSKVSIHRDPAVQVHRIGHRRPMRYRWIHIKEPIIKLVIFDELDCLVSNVFHVVMYICRPTRAKVQIIGIHRLDIHEAASVDLSDNIRNRATPDFSQVPFSNHASSVVVRLEDLRNVTNTAIESIVNITRTHIL